MTTAMVCVCHAPSRDEAELFRQMLDDFDIPAVLGVSGAALQSRISSFCSVPVLVRPELLTQAQQILECLAATDDPDVWDDGELDDDDDDYDDEDDDYDDDDDDDDDDYDDDDDDEFDDDEFDPFEE